MLSYCLKCKNNMESKNSKFVKTENGRIMLLSKCVACDSKKLKFKDKACFQHDIAYGDFKDLNRTAADKSLLDEAFNIAKNPKYDGYQRGLASVVYNFLIKKLQVGLLKKNMQNEELAKELHKPIIKKFEKRKVHSSFIDNLRDADLADMQLISKFNKEFTFFLCVIDIYSKYASVIPLKNKKGTAITNAFQKIVNESNQKPNKIWLDKGSQFYNRSMKSWLEKKC